MISPEQLAEYLATLRAAGVTGPVTIDGITLTLAPPKPAASALAPGRAPRSAKADYDAMLFACTEGLPDDDSDDSTPVREADMNAHRQ